MYLSQGPAALTVKHVREVKGKRKRTVIGGTVALHLPKVKTSCVTYNPP